MIGLFSPKSKYSSYFGKSFSYTLGAFAFQPSALSRLQLQYYLPFQNRCSCLSSITSMENEGTIYYFKYNLLSLFTALELESLIASNLSCAGHGRRQLRTHHPLWKNTQPTPLPYSTTPLYSNIFSDVTFTMWPSGTQKAQRAQQFISPRPKQTPAQCPLQHGT